jgi:hypothetical protein
MARRPVQFEALEQRLLLAADLGVIDNGGLNTFLDQVQQELNDKIFSAPIPLVGTQLAEKQAGQIASKVSARLDSFEVVASGPFEPDAEDVKDALELALGDLLIAPIIDSTNSDNSQYTFSLTVGDSEFERMALDLVLGPDGVLDPQLGIEDEVAVSFDWTLDLTFGVR